MDEHLDDFNKLIIDLLNRDVIIDDKDKELLLLNSLPKSYEFSVTTLLHGIIDLEFEKSLEERLPDLKREEVDVQCG